MKNLNIQTIVLTLVCSIVISSCEYYTNPPPPRPPSPDPTENLEPEYTEVGPNSINSPFWRTADFLQLVPENISINNTETDDGLLNMNQMFNGTSDFNGGDSSGVIMKAAYDDENIYILVEWTDGTYNVSQANPLYEGPEDPNRSDQSHTGWTSQQNDDKFMISFDMGGDKKDLWKWSLAISEPLGHAIDMVVEGSEESVDDGDVLLQRNTLDGTNRSAPRYEWNGETQEIVRPLAAITFLDPSFYLLNVTEFTGDIVEGEVLYQEACAECHGEDGGGFSPEWGVPIQPMTDPTLAGLTRQQYGSIIASPEHTGNSRWNRLSDEEQNDLMARLRGFSGLAGYFIDESELSLPDVQAVSNINLARIDYYDRDKGNYQVLFIRPLITNNSDDIQFDLDETREYDIEIYLSDNDDVNRVGIRNQKLIFRSKPQS